MRLPFVKMSGAGNDFVVIDHEPLAGMDGAALGRLAAVLCPRRVSVGADGLVIVAPGKGSRVRMTYWNADGSRAGMCGNAGRCASLYAHRRGWVGNSLTLEADDGDHAAEVLGGRVRLGMRDPVIRAEAIELRFGDGLYRGLSLDTGVPHVVLWVEDLEAVNVDAAGRAFRFAEVFRPEGTNVNFVEVIGPAALRVRTYERGVEGETLACGTGAVAAAVGAFVQKKILPPVELHARGGVLKVGFDVGGAGVRNPTLEGDASVVYEGVFEYTNP